MNTDRNRNPGRIRMQSILVTALIAAWLILPAYAADTEAEDPACSSVSSARQTEQQKTEQSEPEKPDSGNGIAEDSETEAPERPAASGGNDER